MNRREFLSAAVLTTAAGLSRSGLAAPARAPASRSSAAKPAWPAVADGIAWHDVRDWGVEGRAFDDVESYFDRLPKRARDVVRPAVWNLSHDSAGMSVRFEADTPAIYLRYELLKKNLAMPHMPATGVSGVDLYALDGKTWRYLDTHQPRQMVIAAPLALDLPPGRRRYAIHLPLYNAVGAMEIGLPKAAAGSFAPVPPRTHKPVLFYGTSITQGGCASRPGMAFTNILSRRLDRPVLNFGFSGNGKMETEVAQFLAEIDAGVFVIDCNANMGAADDIQAHCVPLVKLVRQKRGSTMPILLLDERRPPDAWLRADVRHRHEQKSAALRQAYDQLVAAGDSHVYWRDDNGLIGDDGEATVDGSHPTDLGMMRYADALEPVLRKLLTA